jgi:hypothetical protein
MATRLNPQEAVRRALELARAVSLLRTPPSGPGIIAIVGHNFQPTARFTFGDKDDFTPAWFFGADFNTGILLIDGITTVTQGTNIFLSWVGGTNDPIQEPVAKIFVTAARKIRDAIAAAGIGIPPNMIVGGLSFGGMIANVSADVFNETQEIATPWEVHTFGAGKSGGRNQAIRTDALNTMYRWFSDTDPFTVNPPSGDLAIAILPIVGVDGALRMSNYVHPSGGISVSSSGILAPQVESLISNIQYTTSLGSWLFGQDNDAISSHFIGTLVARLSLALLNAKPRGFIRASNRERFDPAEVQSLRLNFRSYAQKVRALQAKQNSLPQVVPPKYKYYARRVNGIWTILFQEQIVAWAGHRRAARAMVGNLNATLAHLVRLAVVDPTQVQASIAEILAASQATPSVFVPPLNTIPPA